MEIQILLVLLILAMTVLLFVTEALRVDVIALIVLLSVAWLGLITPQEAFSGFASNAVISMISVMILGYGIERTGITLILSRAITGVGGKGERRLIAAVQIIVGSVSGFMQNIGAAALFLPTLLRISRTTKIPSSRLLMPMGFAAILGGSLTMVGTSTLIILNDLLRQSGLEPFDLFAVTPVGLALLVTGILYFYLLGSLVLPRTQGRVNEDMQETIIETWQLPQNICYARIPLESEITGKTREEARLIAEYGIHLIAVMEEGDVLYAPWRHTRLLPGQEIALLGKREDINRFIGDFHLIPIQGEEKMAGRLDSDLTGFAEVVIPPRSTLVGKSMRQIGLRKHYSVEPLLLLSGPAEIRSDFSDRLLQAGDTLVIYGTLDQIRALAHDENFALITPVEGEPIRAKKAPIAVACFAGALIVAFAGVPIGLSLLSGAVAMILTRVISIDEAYRAIDWRTIFLIGGLIPLGIAMSATGTAEFLADLVMMQVEGAPILLIMLAIGGLTTVFSLFMSNVAATVLLVPLVLIMADKTGLDPRAFALLVGVCASNSFVLPTHQVNALLMGPGGYHNRDYFRTGGIMTVLFLFVATVLIFLLYA